jgi:hypothetical protein
LGILGRESTTTVPPMRLRMTDSTQQPLERIYDFNLWKFVDRLNRQY